MNNKRAALLGHDIRNAVSDILGGLSLADLSPLDVESRQQLQRVRSAGEQLARLSDEVLALITGEAGPGAALAQNLNLRSFLDDMQARWSAHAHEKGLEFALELGADLPPVIGTQQGPLERILANLIGNAMKHTDMGEVTLAVGMRARETLSLTVRDTGPGFSDDALARLFEAGGRPPASGTPGSGLGLHIVHELADQIGGRVEVGNHTLGGARVSVLLPRPAWAPGLGDLADAGAPLPDLTGKSVLVAEDNRTNQLLIRQMLDTLGAECRIAPDGQDALSLLAREHFNLALVDIEMPRLSGLDLIRSLRAREADTDSPADTLPVLAITAYVLSANREEIYEAGADGILAKPIMSLESFGQAIAAVLAKHATAAPPDLPPAARMPALNGLHLDRLLALAGDANGRELLDRLRQDFLSVQSGVQGGLNLPDFALLRARTHVLISLAGAIGSDHLQCMAETLNTAAHNKDNTLTRIVGPKVVQQIGRVLARLDDEYAGRFGKGAE
ncbi:ATP-binding response regulator [Actibacterium sp. D379-3]